MEMAGFKVCVILFCAFLFWRVSSLNKNEFCEKDEATGLCKETHEDEEGPCWYIDPDLSAKENVTEEEEKKEFGKLFMIDGVKVFNSTVDEVIYLCEVNQTEIS